MEQERLLKDYLKIEELKDIHQIKKILKLLLFVPEIQLKAKIIKEMLHYFVAKFSEEGYKIKFFVVMNHKEPYGFICCEINPNYRSRNRKCATFGWLHARNFEACKLLMDAVELFVKHHKYRLLRGNINFPKSLGGIGIQISGFEEQMMYGVPFNNPDSKILDYLERLGYKRDAEYICMEVTQKQWDKGNKIAKDIRLGYLPFKEILKRKDELIDIAQNAFYAVVPDACLGRFDEIMNTYRQVPDSHYKLENHFNPETYSTQKELLEAWNSCDLENALTFLHLAFDRLTHKIVGAIFCLPDLYEVWLGKPITRTNVDTAMVKEEFKGKGIFSALNNIGQLTLNMNGVFYFEGTGIWLINQDAINSVMPHCKTNRKFVVMQKRLKKKE